MFADVGVGLQALTVSRPPDSGNGDRLLFLTELAFFWNFLAPTRN